MEREGSGKRMAIPTMVTIKEAAEKTGLSYYYIRKLCLEKKVVHITAGRKVLINEEKFINFLNGEQEV
ncbi:MAG: excisionase family DNA-binding protein [Pilosibacter sp.]